ncbi:MAG: methyltransferase domain-containing protein [Nitrospirota bacterium]|nr:methyltransferase domain-containing protein [Nitrospirota bacterium]MDP2383902.1 methyltransferase domain-containing protein [Nitrospirota bacterium]MDP3599032.1 methyltransferase domain-containing protein [Nitrospirota bacterium]
MDLAKVERVYTSYAGIYDRIFGKVFHEGRESAIRNLDVQPDEKILEVGVGTGLALPMYPRHCQIVGIDFSEGMLDKAKQRAAEHRMDHVLLHRMDAGAMDFKDDSFDTVVAAYVVTAVPDYRKVVNEMIRVCRPGGRIIMLNHFSNDNKIIAAMEKVISPFTKHLGWRTDLSLQTVLDGTSLQVARKQNVNPLRFWVLVECVNGKHVNGKTHLNGAKNGSSAPAYAPLNGSHRTNGEALA